MLQHLDIEMIRQGIQLERMGRIIEPHSTLEALLKTPCLGIQCMRRRRLLVESLLLSVQHVQLDMPCSALGRESRPLRTLSTHSDACAQNAI